MLLARALLALACAAPLLAAASPVAAGYIASHGDLECSILMSGDVTRFELKLPIEWMLVTSRVFQINLDNLCKRHGRTLVGELVKVCDINPPPLDVKPWPEYTPILATRRIWDGSPSQVSVHVHQYCDE